MKKILLILAVAGGSLAASAQETPVITRVTTSVNPAYTVPYYIRSDFATRYPGITVVMWEPVETLWKAVYQHNNRVTHVYYNNAGMDYSVSLPVIRGYVPEDVITKAINMYGTNVYGINRMRGASGNDVYQVRTMENGKISTHWMDLDGKSLKEKEVFRSNDDEDMDEDTED